MRLSAAGVFFGCRGAGSLSPVDTVRPVRVPALLTCGTCDSGKLRSQSRNWLVLSTWSSWTPFVGKLVSSVS